MRNAVGRVIALVVTLALPASAANVAQEMLTKVNAARAKAGCPALVINKRLTAAADRHAKAMAQQDFFGHSSKNGATFTHRIEAQGYAWAFAAENIGAGYNSADKMFGVWMASPGHHRNIVDCRQTETGIAMYYQSNDKPLSGQHRAAQYYWVEVFARPK